MNQYELDWEEFEEETGIRLDDLSEEEVWEINYERLLTFHLRKGTINPKQAAAEEMLKQFLIKTGKRLYSPRDFNKGEYAMIRPVAKEAIQDPQALFQMVRSSNLMTVSYLKKKKHLEIEFLGGARYRYYNVDIRVFYNLLKAPSHGKYFWRRIRRRSYRYRRVN